MLSLLTATYAVSVISEPVSCGLLVMAQQTNLHLGHFILQGLKTNSEKICQIDVRTGEKETYGSVLKRTISLVRCIRKLGLNPGDVISYSGRNHLHVRIPYYAALFSGCPIVGVDPTYKQLEIKHLFSITKPKLSFCDMETLEYHSAAIRDLSLDTKIITFDGEENNFHKLIEENSGTEDDKFQLDHFDPEVTFAWLLCTSGSTGQPKVAAYQHSSVLRAVQAYGKRTNVDRTPAARQLFVSPVQWLSAYLYGMLAPMGGFEIIQSSTYPATLDHIIDMINKYKPSTAVLSPVLLQQILASGKPCDLTCFTNLSLTGSKIHKDLLLELRARAGPSATVVEMYGQSECLMPPFRPSPEAPIGSCGSLMPYANVKLVDVETREQITEPHKPGELLIKDAIFAVYYNMPEETAACYTNDGWFKSGDVLYRDENNYYYFVERIKMMIKYAGTTIIPGVLEEVIAGHPAVLQVAVVGVEDANFGELPVACVVKRPGCDVTEDDIKTLVAENLSDAKHLHGGVVFLESLPLTSTGKVARKTLRDIATTIVQGSNI